MFLDLNKKSSDFFNILGVEVGNYELTFFLKKRSFLFVLFAKKCVNFLPMLGVSRLPPPLWICWC